MPPELQEVNPIAHIDNGDKDECYRDEHQDRPAMGNAEGATSEPHQQVPPPTKHQHTQPRNRQKLGEERAQIGEQATRHYHLLREEIWSGEEEVQFLCLPKKITFE